jgi:hypothetical protein
MAAEPEDPVETRRRRLITDVTMAGGALLFGLIASPALFWLVAPALIGRYTHGTDTRPLGVGALLQDYFEQLGHGSQMAWVVALGPLLMLGFARLAWALLRPRPEA